MKKKKLLILLTFLMIGMTMNVCLAQTGTDPGDPSTDDPAAPVDGGISLLLAAGAVYGGRKLQHKGKWKN
jgi:hypothetical protein